MFLSRVWIQPRRETHEGITSSGIESSLRKNHRQKLSFQIPPEISDLVRPSGSLAISIMGLHPGSIGNVKERVMSKRKEPVEELVYQGRIKVPYTWSVGEVGSRFFIELRDNQKIFGKRCPACQKVLVPARKICGTCSKQTEEWVEVGNQGTRTDVHRGPLPFRRPAPETSFRVWNHQAGWRGHRNGPPSLRIRPGEVENRDEGKSGVQRQANRQYSRHRLFSTCLS